MIKVVSLFVDPKECSPLSYTNAFYQNYMFRKVQLGMNLHVALQLPTLTESRSAKRAFVRLNACVNAHVSTKRRSRNECLLTPSVCAFKRFFEKMSAHVVGQLAFLYKGLSALGALEWASLSMDPLVPLEGAVLRKFHWAVGTLERLQSLMNPFMSPQATGNGKRPRAPWIEAGKGFLPAMRPLVGR